MRVEIRLERAEPPAGDASVEGREPVRFDGWLELLRVLSDLFAPSAELTAEGRS